MQTAFSLCAEMGQPCGVGPVKIYAQNYLQARLSEVSRQ